MTRAQMTKVFLATLDELSEAPYFVGGKPGKPTLDCDTVLTILLEQVHNWHDVPYPAIRAMFAGLLSGAPMDDVERLLATVSGQLEAAEECEAEAAKDHAEEAEARKQAILERLAEHPEILDEWLALGERIVERRTRAA